MIQLLTPPRFRHDVVLTSNLFMFFLAITYSVIHPIILIFGLLYYVISYIVYKYQVLYVFSSDSDTAGSYWPVVFNRIYIALLFSQAIMVLLLQVFTAPYQSYLIVLLFVITLTVWMLQKRTLKKRFKIPQDEQQQEEFKILHPLYFTEPENAMLDSKMEPILMPMLRATRMNANFAKESSYSLGAASYVDNQDFMKSTTYSPHQYRDERSSISLREKYVQQSKK